MSSEVLPLPDGPTMAATSPGATADVDVLEDVQRLTAALQVQVDTCGFDNGGGHGDPDLGAAPI